MTRRWAWVYEELADLQAADAEELRRQAEDDVPPTVRPDPEPSPAPADEVVDLGLMSYEDAVVELRRSTPPRHPRARRRRR